jgi:uncharacterized protein YjiS (DUF1127 family)
MELIRTHGNSLMSTVGRTVAEIWKQHLVRQERRVSYWQLQNMTDKALKDIGVSRCDIRRKIYDRHD